MNMKQDIGRAAEIAVIGSGCAGMAAAFRLQQAGYRVRILEANDYVGGRSTHLKKNGFTIDQGATIVWNNYESVLGIIKDAGLYGEVIRGGTGFGFSRGPDAVYSIDTEHFLRDMAKFPLSNRSRITLLKLALDSFKLRKRLNYEDLSGVAEFDFETAEDYGRRRLNEELLEHVIRPSVRCLVANPASTASNIDLLFSVCKFMGLGTHWLAYQDGMGSYPQLLSKRFDVNLNARVTGVEEIGERVQVSWIDAQHGERTESFAGCVIAIPAPKAAAIHPTLDPWRSQFLSQVRYAAMQSVGLALSKPPKNIPATMLCMPPTADIFCAIFEHNKAPGRVPEGKGLVNVYTPDKLARELMGEADDVIAARALAAAEQCLPKMSNDLEFTTVRRWDAAVVHTRIGHYRDLVTFREIRAKNDRRIQIAGDYFAPSSQNSASASGEQAAGYLVKALQGPRPRRASGAAAVRVPLAA